MTNTPTHPDAVYAAWARLGAGFVGKSATQTPDLERLLLDTARLSAGHPRLFYGAIAWLADWWPAVARYRLRKLADEELEAQFQPVLGLLIEEAARVSGGHRELLEAVASCRPSPTPAPLFEADRLSPALAAFVKQEASPASVKWGCYAQAAERKDEALRDAAWIIGKNPSLTERTVRKGDLRASILATLKLDQVGRLSESGLAQYLHASRLAVRKSLDALAVEGHFLRQRAPGKRDWVIGVAAGIDL